MLFLNDLPLFFFSLHFLFEMSCHHFIHLFSYFCLEFEVLWVFFILWGIQLFLFFFNLFWFQNFVNWFIFDVFWFLFFNCLKFFSRMHPTVVGSSLWFCNCLEFVFGDNWLWLFYDFYFRFFIRGRWFVDLKPIEFSHLLFDNFLISFIYFLLFQCFHSPSVFLLLMFHCEFVSEFEQAFL